MRGGTELAKHDPHRTELTDNNLHGSITCEQSMSTVSCSRAASMCSCADVHISASCQSEKSQTSCSCGTPQKCHGFIASNSGIVSRGFTVAVEQTVGLASILTPDPHCVISHHEIQPKNTEGRLSSCSDLETKTNVLRLEECQCRKVTRSHPQGSVDSEHPSVGTLRARHPNCSLSSEFGSKGHHPKCCQCKKAIISPELDTTENPPARILPVPDKNLCCRTVFGDTLCPNDLFGDVRPSDDLGVECETTGTSSSCGRLSPFCCNYSNLHARDVTTWVSDATGQSLYHELRPYISDNDDDDADSCSIEEL